MRMHRNRRWRGSTAAAGIGGTDGMTLDRAAAGERLVVGRVADDGARMHAIRFGMTEGAEVTCLTRIPGGPIVLKCGRQEIAVGRRLAQRIVVKRASSGDSSFAAGEMA